MMNLSFSTWPLRWLMFASVSIGIGGAVISGHTLASDVLTVQMTKEFSAGTLEIVNEVGTCLTSSKVSPFSGCVALSVHSANGGLVPGAVLAGTVTITNFGTVPADRFRFFVGGVTVQNVPSTVCNSSNSATAVSPDVGCGRGRLPNALEIQMYYPIGLSAGAATYACVYPVAKAIATATPGESCGFGPLVQTPLPPMTGTTDLVGGLSLTPQSLDTYLHADLLEGVLIFGFSDGAGVQRPGDCLFSAAPGAPCLRRLWRAGESHPLTIAIRFNPLDSAANDFQGSGATFNFVWRAESGS